MTFYFRCEGIQFQRERRGLNCTLYVICLFTNLKDNNILLNLNILNSQQTALFFKV